jgi:predicted nucleotidyltransferase
VLEPLLEEARRDENVIGVVLFGSRGKGAFVDDDSDWDVFVVVRGHRGQRPFRHGDRIETVEVTLKELREPPAWNRYSLAWLGPDRGLQHHDAPRERGNARSQSRGSDDALPPEPGFARREAHHAKNGCPGPTVAGKYAA